MNQLSWVGDIIRYDHEIGYRYVDEYNGHGFRLIPNICNSSNLDEKKVVKKNFQKVARKSTLLYFKLIITLRINFLLPKNMNLFNWIGCLLSRKSTYFT